MKSRGTESPVIRSDKIRPHRILAAASVIVPLVLFVIIMWQDYRIEYQATEQEVLRTAEVFQQHAFNVFETQQLVAERVNDRLLGMSWDEIERSGAIPTFLAKICGGGAQQVRGAGTVCAKAREPGRPRRRDRTRFQ